jgi:hypothetical protein
MSTEAPGDGTELAALRERVARLHAAARRWSWGRLVFFLAAVACAAAAVESLPWAIGCAAAVAAFAACFLRHHAALDEALALGDEATLLEESQARCRSRRRAYVPPPAGGSSPLEQGRLVGRQEPPAWEIDLQAAEDLDITAPAALQPAGGVAPTRTLLGFLDASSTVFGGRRLRCMLLHPLERPEDIRRRQEGVREIADRSAGRRAILEALLPLRRSDLHGFEARLDQPASFPRPRLAAWLGHGLGSLPLAALILAAPFGDRLLALAGFLVLANTSLVWLWSPRTRPALERLFSFEPFLAGLEQLRAALSREALAAGDWPAIRNALEDTRPAVAALERSMKLLGVCRLGLLGELINWLTLWELRWLPAAERTLDAAREDLRRAASETGEAEALVSLALPLCEQEGFELPEVLEGPLPCLEAAELGHPLLDPGTAVRNPLRLAPESNVWLITGSNMAGKSTFLKAAGLGCLLAGAGGPVCARGFRFTPLALLTDINVRDSLDDGKSYFKVEVDRVRRILDEARRSPKMIAIIDEIFRGTNSVERSALSRAILAHLAGTGALCLLATHDLTLAEFAAAHVPRAANKHFRETVDEGTLRFDYRLRDGPTTTRNALRVLELGGYPAEILLEARRLAGEG